MSGEIIAIVAVGVTLAGLLVGLVAWLRQDMTHLRQDIKQVEERLDERINRLESGLRDDMKQLGDRVGRLEHGQAKLEGLLEGLREAITGRVAS